MALRLFNTLTRSVEEFKPLDPSGKKAGMYCCGPTVYDFAHIGNWRTFVFGDLVRRYLEFKGLEVRQVMNITDVDDKIIGRVRENGTTLAEYTGRFEKAFFEDLKALNCKAPHGNPRATEHIDEIKGLIEKLVGRGIAYRAADGSVYFSIEKYRDHGRVYGQLLKLNIDQLRPGQRVKSDEYEKEAIGDFALWKARVPEDGEVFWDSPWGEGRPGWHIECSAMSMKILGPSFDLHLGGEDLIFPHHEDEIAQSEGAGLQAGGQRFVNYWLHAAHLLVEGRKMSKSLGNFFTLRDLLSKGFSGREIRCLLLSAHYRETFNFTMEGLQSARKSLGRIEECLSKVAETPGVFPASEQAVPDAAVVGQFTDALDDDLNVAKAWGVVFEWVRALNRAMAEGNLSLSRAASALATWKKLDEALGLGGDSRPAARVKEPDQSGLPQGGLPDNAANPLEVPTEVLTLVEERNKAKKARDFQLADAVREQIKGKGWLIEDTPKGSKLKRIHGYRDRAH